jgi:hypothetical protein
VSLHYETYWLVIMNVDDLIQTIGNINEISEIKKTSYLTSWLGGSVPGKIKLWIMIEVSREVHDQKPRLI